MSLVSMEHSSAAYRADFALYAAAVVVLGAILVIGGPRELRPDILALALAGLASWTLLEYVLHRFVLHGVQPFRRWHEEHHRRPRALICAPTIVSASLIATLVFLPALLLGGPWRACALTFGLSTAYLAYAVTHHGIHHWRAAGPWLRRRKRAHALHHGLGQSGCYGVTSGLWDRVFGTELGQKGSPSDA